MILIFIKQNPNLKRPRSLCDISLLLLLLTVLAFSVSDTKRVVLCDAEKAEILHLFPVDCSVSCMHWMEVQTDSKCVSSGIYYNVSICEWVSKCGVFVFCFRFIVISIVLKLVAIQRFGGRVEPLPAQAANITQEVSVNIRVRAVCAFACACVCERECESLCVYVCARMLWRVWCLQLCSLLSATAHHLRCSGECVEHVNISAKV